MQVTTERIKDVSIALVNVEEFDASNADEFKRQMAPVLQATSRLVLDLSRVQFVDSSGCGAILSCLRSLTGTGGDLKLCNINAQPRSTFELVRLHRICQICSTRKEALEAFGVAG